MRRRWAIVIVMMFGLAPWMRAEAKKELSQLNKEDQERIQAAQLLYGVGLNFTEDKDAKTSTVEPDPKEIDDTKLRHFIVAYYKPALHQVTKVPNLGNEASIYDTDWTNQAKIGGAGWVLAEPAARRDLCLEVAKGIKDADFRRWTEDYCRYSAAYFATFSLVEFRGEKVTWPTSKAYHGTLIFDAKLWEGDEAAIDPVITVPGVDGFGNVQRIRAQEWLFVSIEADSWAYKNVVKMKARNKEWIDKAEATVAELEKKQAGKNGGVVIFAADTFDPWSPVEAKTGMLDCEFVYWKAYGPKKTSKADVDYDWTVDVDGTECDSGIYDQMMPANISGGPVFDGNHDRCSQYLLARGKHKIEVALWQLKHKKTGDYKVRSDGTGTTVEAVEDTERGKAVAQGKVTCETKNDNLVNRYSAAVE